MSTQVPNDAPKPRLAHLKKWPDFNGYGFNLHAEKGKAGQFIGKVDAGSPAEVAGLKSGDRIVEVNGTNIANENHQQVVTRIKAVPNETKMLVVDPDTDAYYKEKKIVVRGDMPNVLVSVCPDTQPSSNHLQANGVSDSPSTGSDPRPRLCHIKTWPDFQGYGFNLHAEKGKPGQFIGKVDDDSPADLAGLKQGDLIVEVNGDSIGGVNHKEVVQKIKQYPNEVKMLVVDPETDQFYKNKGVTVTGDMPQVESIICPAQKPSGKTDTEVVAASVVTTVESTPPSSGEDGPRPRLCHLKIWEDFQGYGFNLHAEKGKPGQFIGSVDDRSPAQLAGLKQGDKIIEVNGSNVAQMSHGEVVQQIKSNPSQVRMLVIDKSGEEYYKNKGVIINEGMSNVETIVCPDRCPASSEDSGIDNNIPRPRLCHLKKWTDFQGYGFNLQAVKGKPGQFIGKVDPGSPAQSAGLRGGDRIIEVNGNPVSVSSHAEVVEKVKANSDWVKMLVVTKDEELYYNQKSLPLNGSLSNIDVIVCPDQNPAQQNGTVQAEVTPVQVNHVEENGIVSEQTEEEPKKEPEPVPVAAPAVTVAATKPVEPEPVQTNPTAKPASSTGLMEFSGSAKEARERMMGKKKKVDPRQSSLNMREKYELFQKL